MTTTKAAHTPGPWVADNGDSNFFGIFRQSDGEEIAYLAVPDAGIITRLQTLPRESSDDLHANKEYSRGVEHAANAHLLAAAPDLKDGCNALLGLCTLLLGRTDLPADVRDALKNSHRVKEAQAAISRAEGRSNG